MMTKKNSLSLFAILLFAFCATAQAPQKFNYQAVCRDQAGAILDSQAVSIRISIRDLTPAGTLLYQEIHSIVTNTFGLANLEIGGGNVVSGAFSSIPWGAGAKFIEVEIDAGSGYASAGSMQLLSVPYALFAEQSGTGGQVGPTGPVGPTGQAGISGSTGPTGPEGPMVVGTSGQTLRNDGSGWVANEMLYNNGSAVGINTTNPEAPLDVTSTAGGILIPRMSNIQRDAISAPAKSLLIYNLTTNCFETYIGTSWQKVFCGCDGSVPVAPAEAAHQPAQYQITWKWFSLPDASGYKWNIIDHYPSASDNGSDTSFNQTALMCDTPYMLYIWAYNNCGNSPSVALTDTTVYCPPCGGDTIFTDPRDGQTYELVEIGTQCWMKQNLNYNQNTFGYDDCFNSDPNICIEYGRLYDWDAVMQGAGGSNANPSGVQGVCPTGYHVPSVAEWEQLINFLGGDTIAGGSLKEDGSLHWMLPNTGATNSSNFTALPGGMADFSGPSLFITQQGFWWTATDDNPNVALSCDIHYDLPNIFQSPIPKERGLSVRCVKD